MSKELTTQNEPISQETLNQILLTGDLSKLNNTQKVQYADAMCNLIGIPNIGNPFDYIPLKGKLTLYATRKVSDFLAFKHNLSYEIVANGTQEIGRETFCYIKVRTTNGSRFIDTQVMLPITGLTGENLCNALLKCETKAKRRGTLQWGGIGMLDETEVESVVRLEGKATVIEKPAVDPRKLQLIADVKEYAQAMGWEATTLTDFWGTMRNLDNIEAQLAYFNEVKTSAGGEIEVVKTEDVTVNDLPFDSDI